MRGLREEAKEAGARLAHESDAAADAQRREQKRLGEMVEALRAELAAAKKQLEEANSKVCTSIMVSLSLSQRCPKYSVRYMSDSLANCTDVVSNKNCVPEFLGFVLL